MVGLPLKRSILASFRYAGPSFASSRLTSPLIPSGLSMLVTNMFVFTHLDRFFGTQRVLVASSGLVVRMSSLSSHPQD